MEKRMHGVIAPLEPAARIVFLRFVRQHHHDFAVDEIREHCVELLRFAAMDFVGTEMSRPSSRSLLVPVPQECLLSASRFAPTDAVAPAACEVGIDWQSSPMS